MSHSDTPGPYSFFSPCPRYMEELLAAEIRALAPDSSPQPTTGGVAFAGPIETGLRVCLWSRLADRVLLELERDRVAGRDDLYALARHVAWERHFSVDETIAVFGHSAHSAFRHSGLPFLVVKDAVCDRFRARTDRRPSVDTSQPDIRISLYLTERTAIVYLDLAGESLHRRGYRTESVTAPLRENTAAAVLIRSGWLAALERWRAEGGPPPLLVDPMCGSGTIPIEAALMATDSAPGLTRSRFGFESWSGYDRALRDTLLDEARERQSTGIECWRDAGGRIWASDRDPDAVAAAQANADRAGVSRCIEFAQREFAALKRGALLGRWTATVDRAPESSAVTADSTGYSSETESRDPRLFLVTNPPYGMRLDAGDNGSGGSDGSGRSDNRGSRIGATGGGASAGRSGPGGGASGGRGRSLGGEWGGRDASGGRGSDVEPGDPAGDTGRIYAALGRWLAQTLTGFSATVLAVSRDQLRQLGLQAERLLTFYNGGTEVVAGVLRLDETNRYRKPTASASTPAGADRTATSSDDEGTRAIINRLRKNRRMLRPLLREGIVCYRLYDADIPQYAAAIDVYSDESGGTFAVLQEYAPPPEIPPDIAAGRLEQLRAAAVEYLNIGDERIVLKQRRRQRGTGQYAPDRSTEVPRIVVEERGMRFEVRPAGYIDTGLFCDKRDLRGVIRSRASGCRFLNLFAYTCSASVAAALGGASETVSVDTSRTYLEWGRRNLRLNQLDDRTNRLVNEDSLHYLESTSGQFDLILVDPPTFSNSKSRDRDFDLQRDHSRLISLAAARLARGGTILFANNYRRFRLDSELTENMEIEDLSDELLPPDFARSRKRHHVFDIRLLS